MITFIESKFCIRQPGPAHRWAQWTGQLFFFVCENNITTFQGDSGHTKYGNTEVFASTELSRRLNRRKTIYKYIQLIDYMFPFSLGLLFSNGDIWRVMRRFTFSALRDFRMGSKMMEDKITEECRCLVNTFKAYGGQEWVLLFQ